jgi:signal transduction histidine kinase/FixJ family two-component response regulator
MAEDSEDDALLLMRELRQGGYEATFERVDKPEALSAALSSQNWDLLIADYTMPHFKGTDALEIVKESGIDVPVIFVSGTIGEDTAVAAMKAGAQDYIMKGNLKRFVPAVERELREAEMRHERRLVEERVQRQQERLRALQEINQAITSTLSLRSIMDLLLEKIDLLLPFAAATTVRLVNRQSGDLEPIACRDLDDVIWKAEDWDGRNLAQVVFRGKAPLMITNVQANPGIRNQGFFRRHGLVSYLGIPLIAQHEPVGVIGFYTKKELRFSNEDLEFLSAFAGQAAVAIHNSQLYEEISRQAAELEKANKAKAEFLSVMSHELRTPISAVTGYTEMLRNKILGKINLQQEEALGKILRNSKDLLNMINSILESNRIESGKAKAEIEDVYLGYFLRDLRAVYDIPLNKEVTLIWNYAPLLPVIKTDAWKLNHILQNLINNAIKYTDRGRVIISARYLAKAKTVEFKVEDTGIGIPREAVPVIFEMFRRVDSSGTRSYPGVGLGLYIVKTFTDLLGGMVEVKSAPGRGSTFTVTIPSGI